MKSINIRHKDYEAQCKRGLERKLKLVSLLGNACNICGYNKNYAALVFHHQDPSIKKFGLDLRQCSNRAWDVLVQEANKCQLVCHNCHMELHYPNLQVA